MVLYFWMHFPQKLKKSWKKAKKNINTTIRNLYSWVSIHKSPFLTIVKQCLETYIFLSGSSNIARENVQLSCASPWRAFSDPQVMGRCHRTWRRDLSKYLYCQNYRFVFFCFQDWRREAGQRANSRLRVKAGTLLRRESFSLLHTPALVVATSVVEQPQIFKDNFDGRDRGSYS